MTDFVRGVVLGFVLGLLPLVALGFGWLWRMTRPRARELKIDDRYFKEKQP